MGTTAYVTGGWGKRATAIKPLTPAGEKYWIDKLIGEANRELKADLATAVSYSRTLSAVRRQAENVGRMSMLCLGASNSSRTAAALRKKGMTVTEIGRKGWTLSDESVDAHGTVDDSGGQGGHPCAALP
jgi:hypothetical protein